MQTSVGGIVSDIFITSILLTHNKQDPKNVYLIHCEKCGQPIKKVQGLVWSVSAGQTPTLEVPTIDRCKRCHEHYTFQTFTSVPNRKTDILLTLSYKPGILSTFHCILCSNPLLQYNERSGVILPKYESLKIGMAFNCFLPICRAKYYLADIVEYEK